MFTLSQGSGNEGVDPREMDVSVFYKLKTVLLKGEDEKPHGEQGVKIVVCSVWSGGTFEDGRQIVNGKKVVVHPDMLELSCSAETITGLDTALVGRKQVFGTKLHRCHGDKSSHDPRFLRCDLGVDI